MTKRLRYAPEAEREIQLPKSDTWYDLKGTNFELCQTPSGNLRIRVCTNTSILEFLLQELGDEQVRIVPTKSTCDFRQQAVILEATEQGDG